jgi:DNA-binding NtrC family response regulator/pSer/pThr/pTyr-binding forkhead associated (FHA) protein
MPTTEPADQRELDRASHRVLIVISGESVFTLVLPESGSWTIGRAPDNRIQIDDSKASRTHAALHIGEALELEDLASANGTKLSGQAVPASQRVTVEPGALIEIGSTLLVVQSRGALPVRPLASHGHFEARLEEELLSRRRTNRSPLAVIRVRLEGEIDRATLESALTEELRPQDLVAGYAPGEFELLVTEAARPRAERVASQIRERLSKGDVAVSVAMFPEDGTNAQELIARASLAPRGEEAAGGYVVADGAMKELHRVIERVALGNISVLLLGETGVGKEVIAETLHARSPRRDQPLVRLNCAALSETLVESELFGHEKGAFTGAKEPKLGLMEAADKGTLFLDEVGELPLTTQAKLLRAIEQREVLRVGAVKPRAVDVRVVSATNRDLEADVRTGRFRRDLLYRLNGVSLEVPPLRKRRSEIGPLVRTFLARSAAQLGFEVPSCTAPTLELLEAYAWPGNIRELRNVIERAVLLAQGGVIEPVHLPFEKLSTRWTEAIDEDQLTPADRTRKGRIVEALDLYAGNQTRAADHLGVSRQTLSKWLDAYGLKRPRRRG